MARGRQSGPLEPEQAEGYFASVSDLMAALIFVFILTVAVFALRLAETVEQLTDSREVRATIVSDLAERIEDIVAVEVAPEHGVLHIRESSADPAEPREGISFDIGRPDPTPDSRIAIGLVARALAEVLSCYVATTELDAVAIDDSRPAHCGEIVIGACASDSGRTDKVDTLLIEGHTDKTPFLDRVTGRDLNLDLSSQRAAAVFREMVQCQPLLGEFGNTSGRRILGVSGYGPYRQEFDTDDKNRRIDLRFMMELPDATGVMGVLTEMERRVNP